VCLTDPVTRLTAALADRYRIERELGQGGMATVYLAEDLKHDRKVALKVLKPELAAVLGAERFVVEIKTTAALQHPHILPLFDSGTADGFLFYVMPYIQGETIRDKLNRETQFGVDEAVRIAREVADALDYAHRNGVIHRDIKPENLLLHDGRAMVMDFGIALAVSAAASGRMTETGLSLGTPHYMSPEQATAEKDLTPRADVYSLASVLYEMLTGNPPHTGATVQQIIMKIITEAVEPVTKYRKTVPPHVVGAVARALEKLPADRFESAKAFRDALGSEGYSYATTPAGLTAATLAGTANGRWGGRHVMIAASAVAVVAIAAAAAGWLRPTPEQPFRRFDLVFGAVTPNPISEVVISPDGSMIALSGDVGGERAIYLRHLDGDPEFRKISGTESGSMPSFSPDNQWIVFRKGSERSLVKISVGGGGAVTLVPGGKLDPYWPHWGTADQIIFPTATGAHRVAASGGEPVPMPKVQSRRIFLLPDGSGVLHSASGEVSLYDFKTDSSVVLIPSGAGAVYVPTGHLLYNTTDGGTFAVKFNLAKRRVEGAPVRVLERVGGTINVRGYWVSASGVLVQHDAEGSGNVTVNLLVIVDPGQGADTVRLPPGRRSKPRFSLDGRSIAMEVAAESRNGATDIYTLNLVTGTYTQLTFDGDNDEPVWSPDGKRILFDRVEASGSGEDLYIKPADNSGPERRLTTMSSGEFSAQQWIDDKTLLFDAITPDRAIDAFTMGADSGSVPVPYLKSPFNEGEPHLSPDRKLIVFTSDEAGGLQVWMRDYPVPQGKWNISRGDARSPRWSPDGKFVYFWRAGSPLDTLFRVRVDRTPSVVVQAPEVVVAMNADGIQNWDLHPDGRRFIVAVAGGAEASTSATAQQSRYLILQNWFSELRRLTAPRAK
jgi:Tol biopolymer transport system component/tRNA A-37 threonylcarbamoyl transferase component Bud32